MKVVYETRRIFARYAGYSGRFASRESLAPRQ
jgi:hypothetical protein